MNRIVKAPELKKNKLNKKANTFKNIILKLEIRKITKCSLFVFATFCGWLQIFIIMNDKESITEPVFIIPSSCYAIWLLLSFDWKRFLKSMMKALRCFIFLSIGIKLTLFCTCILIKWEVHAFVIILAYFGVFAGTVIICKCMSMLYNFSEDKTRIFNNTTKEKLKESFEVFKKSDKESKKTDKRLKSKFKLKSEINADDMDEVLSDYKDEIPEYETEEYENKVNNLVEDYNRNSKLLKQQEDSANLIVFVASNIIIIFNGISDYSGKSEDCNFYISLLTYFVALCIWNCITSKKEVWSFKCQLFFSSLNSGSSTVVLIEMALYYTICVSYREVVWIGPVVAFVFVVIFFVAAGVKFSEYMKIYKKECDLDSQKRMQMKLAKCVRALADTPIKEKKKLEEIFEHLNVSKERKRYDYFQVVNEKQNNELLELNRILATLDNDFELGTRELGFRGKKAIENWDEICSYKEVYIALADIIQIEEADGYFTWKKVRELKSGIAKAKKDSPAPQQDSGYPTEITEERQYAALKYEIQTYMGEKAYGEVFREKAKNRADEYFKQYKDFHFKDESNEEITEEDMSGISDLAKMGRKAFERKR